MKLVKIVCVLLLLCVSCATEDEYEPYELEQVFSDNLEQVIKVDIIRVETSDIKNTSSYNFDSDDFVKNLNGSFFNRIGIGLELGETRVMINDELYDLRDNKNSESRVFLNETKNDYNKNRISIYIIKRTNTYSIAGIGNSQRALITDEFLYKSTAPHEIGHALGLLHHSETGNIMSEVRPYLRKFFNDHQVGKMKQAIGDIKSKSKSVSGTK